jgi:hypothetical protein
MLDTIQHPIVIMSFNRPAYFAQVIESLKNQKGVEFKGPILLFQDGAVNPVSGKRYAADEDIVANIELFRKAFPEGEIHASADNLGVAMNFDRAERHVFENLDASRAYFFEDDLLLGPYYLKSLDRLAEIAFARPDIGYVAAYGDHRADIETQRCRAGDLTAMSHNWAFALSREQWRRSAKYVDQYLAIMRKIDYRERQRNELISLFHSWGCGAPGTSQDVAKTLACYLTGGLKVNTAAAFGRYIGEQGLHSNPTLFAKLGYASTQVMEDDAFTLSQISDAQLSPIRASLAHYASSEIAPLPAKPAPPPVAVHMTNAEAALLTRYLNRSKFYLEFGCGGTTSLALKTSKAKIVSVESDPQWISKLKENSEISEAVKTGRLYFHHADIGPVGAWGVPKDESRLKAWKAYYVTPWIVRDYDYDLVLIDGRFRVLCAMAAAFNVGPDAIIAMHDYGNRRGYFVVERYFDIVDEVDKLIVMRKRPRVNQKAWLLDFADHLYDVG